MVLINTSVLPKVKSDEFLPSVSHWLTVGGLGMIAVCATVVSWAAITPYRTLLKAPGNVRPTGEIRLVQSNFAGAVAQLNKQPGDVVAIGDVIATLEKPQLSIQQQQLSQSLQNQQQQQWQIDAQLRSLTQQTISEKILTDHTVAAATAELARAQQDNQERQSTAQTRVDEAISNLELAQVEMEKYQFLANQGVISKLQAQSKYQAFKVAQAQLDRAQISLTPNTGHIKIATEQIAQNEAKGKSKSAVLEQEKNYLEKQKLELQQQINHNQKELDKLKQEMSQQSLKSPIAGKIAQLNLRNSGQVVNLGDTIAQIVPINAPLEIKIKVPTAAIAKVKVCPASQIESSQIESCPMSQVMMQVEAYPYPDYGLLPGIVRLISADVIRHDGEDPYYEVTIEPTQKFLSHNGQKYPIQPGMSVTADLQGQKATVLDFLVKQARLSTGI